MTSTVELSTVLDDFFRSRRLLAEIYESCQGHFTQLKDILRDDLCRSELSQDEEMMFLSKKDKMHVEKVLKRDPVVVITGQTNCGKTSLLNELLGGSYFPTSCLPCTARVVRVKYAEENYLQVYGPGDVAFGERQTFQKKKVPEGPIALSDDSRSDEDEVQYTVEVGIKHDLLKCGLQIVDVPGLSENQVLDDLVAECLDGMLQVLIYVIDGKTSLRNSDTQFLLHLKTIAPTVDILYVCNKVEINEVAQEMDQFSDDSDDSNGSDIVDRGRMAFMKLKKAQLLPHSQEYSQDRDNYHTVSCLKVREDRLKKETTDVTKKFTRLKDTLLGRFAQCVNFHLQQSTVSLLLTQKRLFDFFISTKMINIPKTDLLQTVSSIIKQQREHYRSLDFKIDTRWYRMIEDMIDTRLEQDSMAIKEQVQNLEFQPITLKGDLSSSHVIVACRLQVRDFVLMLAIEGIEKELLSIEAMFDETLSKNTRAMSAAASTDRVHAILQNHLSVFWQRQEMKFNVTELKKIWVDGLRHSVKTKLKQHYEDMRFKVTGIYLDAKWKQDTAAAVLRSINPHSLSKHVVDAIRAKLRADHQAFEFAMNQITQLCRYSEQQAHTHWEKLKNMIPRFSKDICITEALYKSVVSGRVTVGEKIGKGSRMEVYECQSWDQFKSEEIVVKKCPGVGEPPEPFCSVYNYGRLLADSDSLQKVAAVAYDAAWDYVIVVYRHAGTLYDELRVGMKEKLAERIKLGLKIIDLSLSCANQGLRLNDLRPNSFIFQVSPKDGRRILKLDFSKWKDMRAVYPDGGPPFHFAPEELSQQRSKDHPTFDAYSLAVLLLYLITGTYVRPPFAHSENSIYENAFRPAETCEEFLKILEENWRPDLPDEVYSTVISVLQKYLQRSPEGRMDIRELYKDIKQLHDTVTKKKAAVI